MIWIKNLCGIAGILCLAYSVLVFGTHSGTASFLMWILLGIVLLGTMIFLRLGLWGKIPQLFQRVMIFFVLAGMLLFAAGRGQRHIRYFCQTICCGSFSVL